MTLVMRDVHPIEDQSVDMQVDVHACAPAPARSSQRKSPSLIGRSSLRNLARAAISTSGRVTAVPFCAARKAQKLFSPPNNDITWLWQITATRLNLSDFRILVIFFNSC